MRIGRGRHNSYAHYQGEVPPTTPHNFTKLHHPPPMVIEAPRDSDKAAQMQLDKCLQQIGGANGTHYANGWMYGWLYKAPRPQLANADADGMPRK